MIDPSRPPKKRPGFRWEYRTGCQCKSCPWKGNCRGEDTPHWIQIKEPIVSEAPTADKLIDVLQSLKDTEDRDVEFFRTQWRHCVSDEQERDLIKSFRRQMLTVAAHVALERS